MLQVLQLALRLRGRVRAHGITRNATQVAKLKIVRFPFLIVSPRDSVDVLPWLGPLIEHFEVHDTEDPTESECKDFLTAITKQSQSW